MYTTILELVTRVAQATDDPIVYPDPEKVTPGVWGFVLTAAVAIAVVGLGFDMVRRIRRTNYKAEITERLEAELAARDAAAVGAAGNVPGFIAPRAGSLDAASLDAAIEETLASTAPDAATPDSAAAPASDPEAKP